MILYRFGDSVAKLINLIQIKVFKRKKNEHHYKYPKPLLNEIFYWDSMEFFFLPLKRIIIIFLIGKKESQVTREDTRYNISLFIFFPFTFK